jgi:hypothetical protein
MTTTEFLPGDFALVRTKGFVGWAIRLGTRSRYNHVRLIISTDGRTLEAESRGAVNGHVQPDDLVIRPPMTRAERARISRVAGMLKGRPYGFLDVAALGLAQFGVMLPSVKRKIANPKRLFCSQLVDYAWTLAGFHAYRDDRVPQDVSPGDLGDLAFRDGWKVVQA